MILLYWLISLVLFLLVSMYLENLFKKYAGKYPKLEVLLIIGVVLGAFGVVKSGMEILKIIFNGVVK